MVWAARWTDDGLNNITMQIQAYQFVKYDSNTSIEHIEKVLNTGAVICFDFEDGIANPINKELSVLMKEEARQQFTRLYSLIRNSFGSARIGIRLNSLHTSDIEKDLYIISGKLIDCIILPKVEESSDIEMIKVKLNQFKVEYRNLIPIIETKKALENLENILQSNQELDNIAFGHCDYNLDIGAYPFFHQDSLEYWKWIAVFISKIEKYGIRLINSPYLNTDNDEFFSSMLDYMASKRNHFCGQATLSTRQSEICNSIKVTGGNFKIQLENKNKIAVDEKFALDLVEEFETNNKSKGLTKSRRRFISLQEYLASKYLINDNRDTNEICFVGGCFPIQHNIVYEDLFHQKLKRKIEERYNNRLNVNIIRYERFSTVLDKVKTLAGSKKLDLIVFHVRPEPYLRLLKMFYKYINNKGRIKWSLNLPFFKLLNPEKYDMLDLQRRFPVGVKLRKSLFYKMLISFNYLSGIMIGNKRYALKSYSTTTKRIIDFCIKNDIRYIVLGPNLRNNNYLEPSLCKELDLYISDRIGKSNYVSGLEVNNYQKMNQENGIHVTQECHDLIAEKLYDEIVDKKLLCPKSKQPNGMHDQARSRYVGFPKILT